MNKQKDSLENLIETMGQVPPVIHRKLNREIFNKALEEAGARFPPHQLHILKILYHRGETQVSKLQEELAIAKPQMSHSINNLIKTGMVKKQIDKTDKRKVKLSLTPKTRQKMKKVEEAIKNRMRKKFSKLDEKEMEEMAKCFEYISEKMMRI